MTRTAYGIVLSSLALAMFAGCGGSKTSKTATAPGGSKDPNDWPADDHSMCKVAPNRTDVEVSEIAGKGALKPNVRRVYRVVGGTGISGHRIIECREIDTNLDGIKDVVRTYDEQGLPKHDEADRNYDGKPDVWTDFVAGHVAEESVDTNGDGKPDVWKFYTDGRLQRIRRDRNFDGQPDAWEIYSAGRLERMGVDETFDGHVDRWDRDDELKRQADMAEQKARSDMDAVSDAGAAPNADADASAPEAETVPSPKSTTSKSTTSKTTTSKTTKTK